MRRRTAIAGVCLFLCLCGAIVWSNFGFPGPVPYGTGVPAQETNHQRLISPYSNHGWVAFFQDNEWAVLIGFGGLFASLLLLLDKPRRQIDMTREEKLEALRRLRDRDQ